MSLDGLFPIEKWLFSTRSVLNMLNERDYAFLIGRQDIQEYRKGETVFKEGMVPSGIYYIHSGKVKKYKKGATEKEQIIYVANRGELIGYHAVLSEERYQDSAAVLEDSSISFIPKEDFLEVLQRSPQFAISLLKALSHEFTVFANNISAFSDASAVERLAIALIVFREKSKAGLSQGVPIVINISRSDLAGIAGIAKENVIRLLKEFKSEGIISTQGRKIWIQDIEKLVKRSNRN
ncbi:Crp/Fnr family transcriptional regulator [Pedobacter ginsengisoli]|uniref:Crp/Fnr family transcriptional regulator n=1 Tax=Pedobacter ginsengisoli TaxID=363852 RepID=A0A2D1U1X6_9SPHI|nr:Crp/Fnr family transcriptional regulator [Pedobacter ginsengisoli]ATP55606.1 Crp/Fnr family transcriptional regulator [Pedobacter ginsengisoli]